MKNYRKLLANIKLISFFVGLVVFLSSGSDYGFFRSLVFGLMVGGLAFFGLVLVFTERGEPKEEGGWNEKVPGEYQS